MDAPEKQDTKTANSKKTATISVVLTLLAVFVVLGLFFAWQKYSQKNKELETLSEKIQNLENQNNGNENQQASTDTNNEQTETTQDSDTSNQDEYAGWKTYTNTAIGYKFKYPSDWTIKETDEYNDILLSQVKYITLTPPGKKYFLLWGLKEKNDSFAVSDRTGIGAGDLVKDGKIEIIGNTVDINRFVYQKKTKEVFYPASGTATSTDGKYQWTAGLSYNSGSNYDSVDIGNAPEKTLAEKILKSVSIIAKIASSSACTPSFSNEEKLNLADWKKFENSTYGFSFKYPKDWTLIKDEPKEKALGNIADKVYFGWKSELPNPLIFPMYNQTSQINTAVACQKAKKTYFSGKVGTGNEKTRLTVVDFYEDGKSYLVTFSYQYIGASISSDMAEMFDLLLKTVEFDQ
jgi:hypothetical protein